MKKELEKAIEGFAKKCQNPIDSNDALKYTQAALNAAHTIELIDLIESE